MKKQKIKNVFKNGEKPNKEQFNKKMAELICAASKESVTK